MSSFVQRQQCSAVYMQRDTADLCKETFCSSIPRQVAYERQKLSRVIYGMAAEVTNDENTIDGKTESKNCCREVILLLHAGNVRRMGIIANGLKCGEVLHDTGGFTL